MAAIERGLPPELLLDIFGRLATEDVRSSRLVCKRFNHFSSSHLLDKTYFALRPKTLDVFIDITRHPVFSRCIKELIFDASYFDKSLTRIDKYERAMLSMAKHPPAQVISCSSGCGNDPSNVSTRIPLGFDEYCSLFAAQERMKARDRYRHDLQQGLMNLPNLRSIVFSDWRTIARWIERMSSAWDNKSTTGPASWYLQKGPMSWDVKNALWPTDIRDAMQDRAVFLDLDNSVIPFRNLLRAVSDAGVQIRKVGGFSDAEDAVDIWPQALPPCVGGWGLLEKIGPHLDTIEMAFYIKIENSEPSRLVQRLEGLMQAAPNLTSVSLRFRGGAHLITSITVLDNALSSYKTSKLRKWPKLRIFRLSGFDHIIHEQELEDFLVRHRHSLKELGLEAIELAGCRWNDLVLRMSANVSLEAATLAFLYDPCRGPALFDDHSTGRCHGLEQILLRSQVNTSKR